MTATYAIITQNLEKEYSTAGGQKVHALRGVDLSVRAGEIYALLGPNGAGKSTTLGILTTLLLPTRGSATVAGYDVVRQPAEVRRQIGVTFQEVVLDQELTGRHILDFHGQLYGISIPERRRRIEELGTLVELCDELDRRAAGYSGGMKRRLELARGLMTRPQLLFLDEPTQGLDPHNRAGIWRYIRRLRDEEGITLLLTTHYMEEAEALADRVGIIDHGKLVVEGSPAELVRGMGADIVTLVGAGDPAPLTVALKSESYVDRVICHPAAISRLEDGTPAPQQLQIGVDQGNRRLVALLNLAAANNFQIHEVTVSRPSLGEVFLAHTGHALRDKVVPHA